MQIDVAAREIHREAQRGHELSREERMLLGESLFQVRDPDQRKSVPLTPNAMQRDILATITDREVAVKWRRAGLTTCYVEDAMLDCILRPTLVEVFAHDQDTAEIVHRDVVRPMWESLPDWCRPHATTRNVRELAFDQIGSRISVGTAGASEAVAKRQGQARTIDTLICTEYAFYAFAEQFLEKAINCVPQIGGKVRLDSTPNGQEAFYQRFRLARAGIGEWRARFYPWWWSERLTVALEPGEHIEATAEELQLGERNPFADDRNGPNRLTPEQIKWRRKKILDVRPRGTLTSRDVFRVEFPEDDDSCFLHSGRPVFMSRDLVKRCQMRESVPWHRHVIGHDSSTGDASGHPCGFSVIDVDATPCEQVYGERAWIPVEAQVAKLIELQRRYPGMILPERNGPGVAVLALLRAQNVDGVYMHHDRELKEGARTAISRKPGFPMSDASKPHLFTELQHALSESEGHTPELLLSDPCTIDDLKGFQYDDNDRITYVGGAEVTLDAGMISHGDVGVATALAWYGRKIGGVSVA